MENQPRDRPTRLTFRQIVRALASGVASIGGGMAAIGEGQAHIGQGLADIGEGVWGAIGQHNTEPPVEPPTSETPNDNQNR